MLLNQTQTFFEDNVTPPEGILEAKVDDGAAREKEIKYKNKLIGNMKFIGNLLKYRILANRLLLNICQTLLEQDTPITIECLCVLVWVGCCIKHFFAACFASRAANSTVGLHVAELG